MTKEIDKSHGPFHDLGNFANNIKIGQEMLYDCHQNGEMDSFKNILNELEKEYIRGESVIKSLRDLAHLESNISPQ